MRTLYFDKTGTLTHSTMKVANVFSIKDRSFTEITDDIFKHSSILDLFGVALATII